MSINNEDIINAISKMNVLELIELTKLIEKKFDISMNQISPKISNNENITDVTETIIPEKTVFSVIMTSFGDNKLNVIKTVRTILNLGLKEAKEFVEALPATIKNNIQKQEAEDIKKSLEISGAKIEIK
jgi:large subunit ribosomal protein L7/L12